MSMVKKTALSLALLLPFSNAFAFVDFGSLVEDNPKAILATAIAGTLAVTGIVSYKKNKKFKENVDKRALKVKDYSQDKLKQIKSKFDLIDKSNLITGTALAGLLGTVIYLQLNNNAKLKNIDVRINEINDSNNKKFRSISENLNGLHSYVKGNMQNLQGMFKGINNKFNAIKGKKRK